MPVQVRGDTVTLSISPDTGQQLTRLLHALVRGEHIASTCARWQAQVTTDPRSRRFFRSQAVQERFHAQLFTGAALWLAPRVSASASRSMSLVRYRRRLASAMSRSQWMEVLFGQQVVLEHLGQVVLARLDAEMNRQGLGFDRLRRTVLRQEQAHHAFGLRLVDAELHAQRFDLAEVQTLVEDYVELADDILVEVSPLLESLDEDAEAYRRKLRCNLPHWAVERAP